MFNDRQKALEELEAELLREEAMDEALPEEEEPEEEPVFRNFSNHYGRVEAYNRDVEAAELEEYVEEVYTGGKPGTKALTILLLLLLAGIFGMLTFLVTRYR